MTTRAALFVLAFAGVISFASNASAQEKAQKGVITLAEVTIVGRVQKPIASVTCWRRSAT